MPITIGSIGDIIALAQLAGKLCKALSASQGSAAEFRDVVLEISGFYGGLESLLVLYPTRPNLESSLNLVRPVINECKEVIEGFLEKIVRRYGRRLGGGDASKKGFKEMGRMLQWHIFEADAVAKLREKVGRASGILQLVLIQAQSAAAEQDLNVISTKLDALSELEALAKADLNRHIVEMRESIEKQNAVLGNHTVMLEKVSSDMHGVVAAVTPMKEMAFDMKNMLVRVQETLVSYETVPRNLTPWLQNALLLEDSLGYTLRVPLETISSWKSLHAVLCDKFMDQPGYELVKRGQYIFQDGANARDLDVRMELTATVRPGQKINMTMILFTPRAEANICPRCSTITRAGSGTDVECANPSCRMIYRRVVDVTDALSLGDKNFTNLIKTSTDEDSQSFDDYDITDCVPPNLFAQERVDDSPDVFKRARLLTRWQDAEESRASQPALTFGEISLWVTCGFARDVRLQLVTRVVNFIGTPVAHAGNICPVAVTVFFIGTSRQRAIPTILLYAKTKRVRRRAIEILSKVDWLEPRKSSVMMTTWHNPTIRRDIIEYLESLGRDRQELEQIL